MKPININRLFVIDTETLGLPPRRGNLAPPALLQVAIAAKVDGITEVRSCMVNLGSSIAAGAVVDQKTVDWWHKTPEKAKIYRQLTTTRGAVPLEIVAMRLKEWFGHWGFSEDDHIFMRHTHFDHTVLTCQINVPWSYKQAKDLATIDDLVSDDLVVVPRDNNHDAQIDAMNDLIVLERKLQFLVNLMAYKQTGKYHL